MRKFNRCVTMIGCMVTLFATLAGCTTSGLYDEPLEGLTRSLQTPVYAENGQETLSGLLQDGEALFPPLSAVLQREPYPETARVRQAPEGATYLKSIAGDGAGGFLAVFENDGKETPLHFSETTRLAESRYPGITHYFLLREDADTFQYFWPWTAVAGVPGFDYLDLYGWSTGRRGTEYSGYSTIGLRTPVQNLTIGTATYTGTMTAEIWASDDSQWGTQVAIHGTSFLAADLDGGRITGNVDGLRVGPVFGDRDAYKTLAKSNRIEISGTMQKDGSFTADWNGQGPETDVETSMTMRGFTGTAIGDLYGPAGEEIGGVLSGTRGVTGTLPEQFIIGAIGASRDDL